ncbi:hypothetical protein AQUCO_00900781v1 [Aquilegia coerulea]|uniref:DUF674 domain-containing protein n=1 Tax=Aquilegia coerulea TaxID=218851 RepID=A0A2G5EFE6_AQUCA|nr:hypothetical protein AQUCO_00900781v1 [Aquilegia coerulea]
MSTRGEKIELKLLMDRKKNQVIFAESGKDFVDVLLSFLTLPMGTIIRLVRSQSEPSMIGSMNTLYQGLENLEFKDNLWTTYKEMLLCPSNSSEYLCQKLKLNIDDTQPTKYYICDCCRVKLCTYWKTTLSLTTNLVGTREEGVFVKGTATFMISDDLKVMPLSTSNCIELLNKLGIKDINTLEEMRIIIGLEEVLSLLRLLFVSETPLSDLFLPKNSKITSMFQKKIQARVEYIQKDPVSNGKKMKLKVILRKSDNKLLYAETGADFANRLLSQLVIPLGTIVKLISASPSLRCASNLYKSVEELGVGLYMNSEHLKKKLLLPKLTPKFGAVGGSGFVQEETTFMVTDDLVLTRVSPVSGISLFNKLNIPISDIEEKVVDFGKEEALKLLEASLISKSALTSAFNSNLKMKKPKLER